MRVRIPAAGWILLSVSALLMGLSFLPVVSGLALGMSGGSYIFPVHNSKDFWTYTSVIRQGLDGYWSVYNMFYHGPQTGSYAFLPYLMLGQAGRIVGFVTPEGVYHTARIVVSAVYLLVLYRFLRRVCPTRFEAVSAYLLAVCSASFPKILFMDGTIRIESYMGWWTEMSPLWRITFLPHHVAGHMALILMVALLLKAEQTGKLRYVPVLCVLGMITAFVHTPSVVLPMIVFPLYGLARRSGYVFLYACVFSACAFALLIGLEGMSRTPAWSESRSYESLSFAVNLKEYLLALGPVVPFALAGIYIGRKRTGTLLFVLWIGVSFLMIWLAGRLWMFPGLRELSMRFPISNIRFLQTNIWVPFAVLGSYSLAYIRKKWSRGVYFGILCITGMLVLMTYPKDLRALILPKLAVSDPYSTPPQDYMRAIMGMSGSRDDGRVLSLNHASMILPTYTGRRSYPGKRYATPDFDRHAGNAYGFFAGMDPCDAYRFVGEYGISSVFYSFDERIAGDAAESYPFLRMVLHTVSADVYKVDGSYAGCAEI